MQQQNAANTEKIPNQNDTNPQNTCNREMCGHFCLSVFYSISLLHVFWGFVSFWFCIFSVFAAFGHCCAFANVSRHTLASMQAVSMLLTLLLQQRCKQKTHREMLWGREGWKGIYCRCKYHSVPPPYGSIMSDTWIGKQFSKCWHTNAGWYLPDVAANRSILLSTRKMNVRIWNVRVKYNMTIEYAAS